MRSWIASFYVLHSLFSINQTAFAEGFKDKNLDSARQQYESGNFERALDVLSQTINSTRDANTRNRAFYYQGLSFFELGLYYSSYLSFRSALLNPDERFPEVLEKSIKNSVLIADRLDLVDRIGNVISKVKPEAIPRSVASTARFAVGVYYFNTSKNDLASRELKSVSPESPYYPKALYYLGILATKAKNYKDAGYHFEKVVSLTRGKSEFRNLEELGKLNLARTAYSAGDEEKSVELYAKFLSSSPYWLDVLLEASWPLLKMNDTAVSLGNLHTILSPFYKEDLVGEGYLLRATLLHRLCKYDEMRRDLASFFKIYNPIIKEMQKEESKLGSSQAYYTAYTSQKENLNRAFVNVLNRDQGIQKNLGIIAILNEERMNLSGISKNEQVRRMIAQVEEFKKSLAAETGKTIRNIHKRKLQELIDQREQANYLKVEVVTGEKELIESQKGLPAKRVVDIKTEVAQDYHFWPFNGEYWEDELGTYIYTTESSCVN